MTAKITATDALAAGLYPPAVSRTEYRTSDIHGHGTLALEKSKQPIGATWRNWIAVDSSLPAEIARIRCDFGNGLISSDEKNSLEALWHKACAKNRRAALSKSEAA